MDSYLDTQQKDYFGIAIAEAAGITFTNRNYI